MDMSVCRPDTYIRILRFYRCNHIYQVPVARRRLGRVDCHVTAGFDLAALVSAGVNRAHRDGTGFGVHRYRSVFSRNILADRNITGLCLHHHIFDYGDVLIQRDVALSTGLHIQCTLRFHVIRYVQVAVNSNQVRVSSGFDGAIVINDNVLSGITGYITVIGRL